MNKLYFYFIIFFLCSAQEHVAAQNLSDPLLKSFPQTKATDFVIFCEEAENILYAKHKSAINLLGMCQNIPQNLKTDYAFSFPAKSSTASTTKIGCVFFYCNKQNCIFTCAIYGYSSDSQNELTSDMQSIKRWLDQFFLFAVPKTTKHIAKIPVFYADENNIDIKYEENTKLLISTYLNKNITKTIQYKTMLRAPLKAGTKIGCVSYQTSTFSQPIYRYITIEKNITKCSRFSTILDSISYIIFATPFRYQS